MQNSKSNVYRFSGNPNRAGSNENDACDSRCTCRGGGPGGPDPCPFSIQSKLCPQVLKPIYKKHFEKSVYKIHFLFEKHS